MSRLDPTGKARARPRRPALVRAAAVLCAGAVFAGGAALFWPPEEPAPDNSALPFADGPGPQARLQGGRMPKRVYDRDDFRDLLAGRTEDEVVSLVGLPDAATTSEGLTVWRYLRVTRERGARQIDAFADVCLAGDRVTELRFPPGPDTGAPDGPPARGPMPREVGPSR